MNILWFRFLLVFLGGGVAALSQLYPAYATLLVGVGGLVSGVGVRAESVHGSLGSIIKILAELLRGTSDGAKVVLAFAGLTYLLYSCSEFQKPLDPQDVRNECGALVRDLDGYRDAGLSCEEARLKVQSQYVKCAVTIVCRVLDAGEEVSDGGSAE